MDRCRSALNDRAAAAHDAGQGRVVRRGWGGNSGEGGSPVISRRRLRRSWRCRSRGSRSARTHAADLLPRAPRPRRRQRLAQRAARDGLCGTPGRRTASDLGMCRCDTDHDALSKPAHARRGPRRDLSRARPRRTILGHRLRPRVAVAFADARLDFRRLEAVLLTHLHADHAGDLPGLLLYPWGCRVGDDGPLPPIRV